MSFTSGLVIGVEKNSFRVYLSETSTVRATLRGRFIKEAASAADMPTVGDRVNGHLINAEQAVIESIEDRKSLLARRAAGQTEAVQLLAANVDTVLVTTSLNQDLNLNRLDRYVTLAWDSGARPVLILTKKDLSPDWEDRVKELSLHIPAVPIFAISALKDDSWRAVREFVIDEKVAVVLGSSGVGKSTLINRLLERELLITSEIREDDDKGRHTTTSRSMWRTPGGGWIIDTPGMRELQLLDQEEGLQITFEDVEALFPRCRFRDCGHGREPGCAVRMALDEGRLEPARWESYRKLQREVEFQKRKATTSARGRMPRRRS